ncbi:MAG: hypothetical protein IKR41_04760 [Bacteroidales bacterium]|nr:hypothetical protein [Bacteroidales bacterium]
MNRIVKILLMLVFPIFNCYSQRFFQPLGRAFDIELQGKIIKDSIESFSSIKPVLYSEYKIDTIEKLKFPLWLKKHFFEDDFLCFAGKDFSLTINPIFNLVLYNDDDLSGEKKYFWNNRGVEIFGRLGERVHFYSEFYENQARFLPFQDSIIRLRKTVIPAGGYAKAYKGDGLDWAYVTGGFLVDVTKNFRLSLSNGRCFIGSGYRSVILSDLTFPFPYLRYDLKFSKFYYYIIHACLKDGVFAYYNAGKLQPKYSSFHVAGYKPLKNLEIAVIETVIWNNRKSSGEYRYKPNADMLLPIIFYPALSYGFNGENSVSLGYDINYSPFKFLKIYHQLNYAGKKTEKDGSETKLLSYQYGFHVFDIFSPWFSFLKTHFQAEQTISRLDSPEQATSFWSYCYPITTPFFMDKNSGKETVVFLQAQCHGLAAELKFLERNSSKYKDFTLRYYLNQKTKWNIFVTYLKHDCSKEFYGRDISEGYLSFGLSMCPSNFYYDF